MKTLVLGGTGFIGSYVVDLLLERGHSVRVFSRSGERFRPPLPNADYRLADFDDLEALNEALQGIEVVYHLINTSGPSASNQNPVYDIESNLVATVRLLGLMGDAKVRKIVYLSSGGTVYGVPEIVPVPEDQPLHPICSYGVVKVAVENYLHMFHNLYGLDYTVIRASNPYDGKHGKGVVDVFLNKARKGDDLDIWGDGGVVRDFVHVKDLAELCVAAGESDKVGIYNGGSGIGYSINEVLSLVEQTAGRKLTVNYLEGRNFDVPQVILDIRKAKHDLNWRPVVDLAEGIKMSWEVSSC